MANFPSNKFNAQKVTWYGETFDSKKEAERYLVLKDMERRGEIFALQRQKEFLLIPKQERPDGSTEHPVKYKADFVYTKDNKVVVEDVKGYKKGPAYNVFVIKRKLMLQKYGIAVKEV